MREFKFRAWDKENSEMKYNAEQAYKGHWQMNDIMYFGQLLDNPKYEVMQYTGLKDKNGKEIYESDIVVINTYSYVEPIESFTSIVKYADNRASFVFEEHPMCFMSLDEITNDAFTYDIEVIGNIYENPETL